MLSIQKIGIAAVIPVTIRITLPVRRWGQTACIVVAVGSASRLAAMWRIVATTRQAAASTASASAWYSSREFFEMTSMLCRRNRHR